MDIPNIILLSGAICAGKSTVARWLEQSFDFKHIKTSELLRERSRYQSPTRKQLQKLGERLDKNEPDWLLKDFSAASSYDSQTRYVVDSIRVCEQAKLFREAFGRNVVHIHLEAPPDTLKMRFEARRAQFGYEQSYETAKKNKTERNIDNLKNDADISINTHRCREQDVQVRVAGLLGLYSYTQAKIVDVIVGGQFGSEGKGNVVAYLAPEYDYIIRVGGPNAGHQAKDRSGRTYTFRQLPSGTANSEARLIIGPGATINVDVLLQEIMDQDVGVDRLSINPHALIISEIDKKYELEKLKETIASTASGSGHAAAMRILNRKDPYEEAPFACNCPKLTPYIPMLSG